LYHALSHNSRPDGQSHLKANFPAVCQKNSVTFHKAPIGLSSAERVINTDKAPTYAAALAELKSEGKCPKNTQHRQIKYLNNIVEADHGKLKQLLRPVRGFKDYLGRFLTPLFNSTSEPVQSFKLRCSGIYAVLSRVSSRVRLDLPIR
jgi:hypothetical protein